MGRNTSDIRGKSANAQFGKTQFLAVQDSSISDIVGLSVCRSEPTNNQSLEIRNAMETNTTVVKVRNTLDRAYRS